MTVSPNPAPAVKADPSRPYKALAAAAVPAIIAVLTVLLNDGKDSLPTWAILLITAVLAGVTTFSVKNPLVGRDSGWNGTAPRDQAGRYDPLYIILVVVAILVALVLFFTLVNRADAVEQSQDSGWNGTHPVAVA